MQAPGGGSRTGRTFRDPPRVGTLLTRLTGGLALRARPPATIRAPSGGGLHKGPAPDRGQGGHRTEEGGGGGPVGVASGGRRSRAQRETAGTRTSANPTPAG